MRKKAEIILILLIAVALTSATAQQSQPEQTKTEWNHVICIAMHILQMVSVGIAVLIIMVAGLKYMTSEDVDTREESKSMIIRVLCILMIIAVTAQVVNYLVAGSSIEAFDINSCNGLFPTTTQPPATTTTSEPPTSGPTTSTNGTSTTIVTTSTTTTSTTLGGLCLDPTSKYSIYGSVNSCRRASDVDQCKTDYYPVGGNGIPDLDDYLGVGFAHCCCVNGYPKCC